MSRKAEEVKVRVTTLEKGWWQEAAAFEGTTLSELIRRTMNEQLLRRPNGAPSATPLAEQLEPEADVDLRGTNAFSPAQSTTCSPEGPLVVMLDTDEAQFKTALTSPGGVPGPRPEWLQDKVHPRRTVACACGKPTFLFCRVCDG